MSTGLRYTFWLHALAALVFGVAYLFFPDFVISTFGLEPTAPFVMWLFGAATLGLGFGSVLAALAKHLEQVAIVLRMEVVYTILATLVCLYAVLFAGAPAIVWVGVAVYAIFFVLFGYYYWQTRPVHALEPGRPAMR